MTSTQDLDTPRCPWVLGVYQAYFIAYSLDKSARYKVQTGCQLWISPSTWEHVTSVVSCRLGDATDTKCFRCQTNWNHRDLSPHRARLGFLHLCHLHRSLRRFEHPRRHTSPLRTPPAATSPVPAHLAARPPFARRRLAISFAMHLSSHPTTLGPSHEVALVLPSPKILS